MNILHLELPLVEQADCQSSENIHKRPVPSVEDNIREIATSGRAAIVRRLAEIEDEWTIDGIFEKSAAVITAGSFALGMMFDYRWFAVPLLIAIFLFQRAIQDWCPAFSVLRGLGFRTEREIQFERHALEDLEGEMDRCHCHDSVIGQAGSLAAADACPTYSRPFSLQAFLLSAKLADASA